MATHQFEPTTYYNAFGTGEPALRIAAGDSVITSCVDAHGADCHGKTVAGRPNPLTGPFYVEGAEPGDTLVVRLDRLYPSRDDGFTKSCVAENVVDPEYVRELPPVQQLSWRIDRAGGTATLAAPGLTLDGLMLPLAPMLGCIGVAPRYGQAISSMTSAEHGGNMDYRGTRAGTVFYFPVFVSGALLFVGDGHAIQGDGEIVGTGIETSFDVQFTVGLQRGRAGEWPRGDDGQCLFTIGNGRPLDQALQHATTEMLRWLQTEYRLDPASAGTLLGQCVTYDLGNIYDPAYTMVCKVRKSLFGARG